MIVLCQEHMLQGYNPEQKKKEEMVRLGYQRELMRQYFTKVNDQKRTYRTKFKTDLNRARSEDGKKKSDEKRQRLMKHSEI